MRLLCILLPNFPLRCEVERRARGFGLDLPEIRYEVVDHHQWESKTYRSVVLVKRLR